MKKPRLGRGIQHIMANITHQKILHLSNHAMLPLQMTCFTQATENTENAFLPEGHKGLSSSPAIINQQTGQGTNTR